MKFTQSTAFEQKRFDLRPLSNALRNLWRRRRRREDRVIRGVCPTVKCGGKGQEVVGARQEGVGAARYVRVFLNISPGFFY